MNISIKKVIKGLKISADINQVATDLFLNQAIPATRSESPTQIIAID